MRLLVQFLATAAMLIQKSLCAMVWVHIKKLQVVKINLAPPTAASLIACVLLWDLKPNKLVSFLNSY